LDQQVRAESSALAKELGWTYEQYLAQPGWLIRDIFKLYEKESKAIKRKQ